MVLFLPLPRSSLLRIPHVACSSHTVILGTAGSTARVFLLTVPAAVKMDWFFVCLFIVVAAVILN